MSFCLLSADLWRFIFFYFYFFHNQLKALQKTWKFNGGSFIFPLPLAFLWLLIILLQEKSQTTTTVFHSKLQWCPWGWICPCCSLTLQHIPLSLLPCRLHLAVPYRAAHLDPPLSSGRRLLALVRAWWGFPSFGWWCLCVPLSLLSTQNAVHPAFSSSCLFCCCSLMLLGLRPSQSLCCLHSFLALAVGKKGPLVLRQCLSCSGPLMTNKRTRFSQRNLQSSSESVCWHHFFSNERRSKRRKFFSRPFGME